MDCCDHRYCKDCITEWSKTENSCPQCKRKFTKIIHKKKESEVEDRRQRPDDPDNVTDPPDFQNRIRVSRVTSTFFIIHRLAIQLAEINEADDINGILRNGVQPQRMPLQLIYHPMCRENTIIYFGHSQRWRNMLLYKLVQSMRRPVPILMDVKVHMIFNIINRFMTNALARYPNAADTTLRNSLCEWMDLAKTIVFGRADETEPIDIDDVVERPLHPPFNQLGIRSNYAHVLCSWCQITGEDPEWLYENTERILDEGEGVERYPLL